MGLHRYGKGADFNKSVEHSRTLFVTWSTSFYCLFDHKFISITSCSISQDGCLCMFKTEVQELFVLHATAVGMHISY